MPSFGPRGGLKTHEVENQPPVRYRGLVAMAAMATLWQQPAVAWADDAPVARGRYLVQIGGCNDCQIATAIRSGVRPDGRVLAPIMPYVSYAHLTSSDVTAIALFLKSLPPIKHRVPGPFAANEKPTIFHWQLLPPEGAHGGSQ